MKYFVFKYENDKKHYSIQAFDCIEEVFDCIRGIPGRRIKIFKAKQLIDFIYNDSENME